MPLAHGLGFGVHQRSAVQLGLAGRPEATAPLGVLGKVQGRAGVARFWLRWPAVAPRHRPTPEEAAQAVELLLNALESDADIFDAFDRIRPLHPKDNTFPGEVFVRLAAKALAEGGVSPSDPISEDGLVERHLPEAAFRGRQNHKIRYAVLVAAATHAGVEVDLLEEVAYWGTDDFWSYAGLAAVAWIRAVSAARGIPVAELCRRLRDTSVA